ncbi:hypothetical protein QTO34_000712 [Cnephaeus nilssonii]|uniref:Uncharacterized protein n=1 Tax=Cnephaeus nilssonii TaxID=3371016 RepID=A0AA40IBW9_CNENI|nr:hypothetical protein QTO34_000712 [Eptesicus nilssonii]
MDEISEGNRKTDLAAKVDTFTNWVEAFLCRTDGTRSSLNKFLKLFPDLGCLEPSRLTMAHHLKQVSPSGSQSFEDSISFTLCLEATVLRKSGES